MLVYGSTVTVNGTVQGAWSPSGAGHHQWAGRWDDHRRRRLSGAWTRVCLGAQFVLCRRTVGPARGRYGGRDLNALCLSARLSGTIGRDTNAMVGLIEALRLIFGGPLIQGGIGAPALSQTEPRLAMASLLPVSFAGDSHLLSVPASPVDTPAIQAETQFDTEKINQWLKSLYQIFLPLLIVGLLAAWLAPAFLSQASEIARRRALLSGGAGLVTLIVGYVGAILLAGLVIVLGYFLTTISLSSFAWLVWGLGLFSSG